MRNFKKEKAYSNLKNLIEATILAGFGAFCAYAFVLMIVDFPIHSVLIMVACFSIWYIYTHWFESKPPVEIGIGGECTRGGSDERR